MRTDCLMRARLSVDVRLSPNHEYRGLIGRVLLFVPCSGSSRPYHTPWSCGKVARVGRSTELGYCGRTETYSPNVRSGLVWSGCGTVLGGVVAGAVGALVTAAEAMKTCPGATRWIYSP